MYVSLDGLENLNNFKKLVLRIKKSWSRSRNLNLVLTPPSSPKSNDQDQEISWDLKFLANLDSLSWSQSRVSQFHLISLLRLFKLSGFWAWSTSILKILTENKNNLVLTVRIISKSFESGSRQIEKSQSRSRLVSTVETPRLVKNLQHYLILQKSNRIHYVYI